MCAVNEENESSAKDKDDDAEAEGKDGTQTTATATTSITKESGPDNISVVECSKNLTLEQQRQLALTLSWPPKKKEKKKKKSSKVDTSSSKDKNLVMDLNCLHCNVKFYNKADFNSHCSTEKHQQNLMSDEGTKWRRHLEKMCNLFFHNIEIICKLKLNIYIAM